MLHKDYKEADEQMLHHNAHHYLEHVALVMVPLLARVETAVAMNVHGLVTRNVVATTEFLTAVNEILHMVMMIARHLLALNVETTTEFHTAVKEIHHVMLTMKMLMAMNKY
jgi:hypothetical protein